MQTARRRKTFSTFLFVRAAAKYLGVSVNTLRSWDSQGKLKARRHSMNGYRLYDRAELDQVLAAVADAQNGHNRAARR